MKRTLALTLFAATSLAGMAGCNTCGSRADAPVEPQAGGIVFPGAAPSGAYPGPLPRGSQLPPDLPPPAPIGAESRSALPYGPQNDLTWKPDSAPSVRLYPPDTEDSSSISKRLKLDPPQTLGGTASLPGKFE